MPKPSKSSRPREAHLLIGTRKGGFLLRSDLRRKTWKIDGPFFSSWEMNHLLRDARSGRLYAALNSAWWGNDLQVSSNNGRTWRKSSAGLGFAADRGIKLNRLWSLCADRGSRPETLWCGADPGALFRTDDGGDNWYEVRSLTEHPTRPQWQPGAGGLCTHTIILDPQNERRMYLAISAAGCFRSDDDGHSWQPMNKGVRADFQPNKYPEVGQCVHRMAIDPVKSEVLYQQNHCGMYCSNNAAASWKDISKGLPSRFGFPIAVHAHESGTVFVVPEISAEARYTPGASFAVWRSQNGGREWQKLTRGLPQKNTYFHVHRQAMTTDRCEQPGIYLGTSTGHIFFSRTGGNSWEMLPAYLPPVLSLEACIV